MKTKTTSKKLLSLLLTLVMVVGMLPLSAVPSLAAGSGYTGGGYKGDPYVVTTCDGLFAVADFTSAAGATKYIKLGANINVDRLQSQSVTIQLGNCELDLNGYTLKCVSTRSQLQMITIAEGSKVTINDTSSNKTGCISFEHNADQIISLIRLNSGAHLVINGGTYRMKGTLPAVSDADRFDADCLISASDNGRPDKFNEVEIIINGGSFYSSQIAFGQVSSGSIIIHDGYFECNKSLASNDDETFWCGGRTGLADLIIYDGHFVFKGMENSEIWFMERHHINAKLGATAVYGGTFENVQGTERCYGGEFKNIGWFFGAGTSTPFQCSDDPYGLWYKIDEEVKYYRAEGLNGNGVWYVPCDEKADVSLYSPVVVSATIDEVDIMADNSSSIYLKPGQHTLRVLTNNSPDWFKNAGGKNRIYTSLNFTFDSLSGVEYADGFTRNIMRFTVSDKDLNLDLRFAAELGDDSVTAGYSNGAVYQNEFHLIKKIKPKPDFTGITVRSQPTKTTYNVGEDFSRAGMVVYARYADGTGEIITNYTVKDGTNLTAGQTSVTLSYTEDGITKTTTVPITVRCTHASVSNEWGDNNNGHYHTCNICGEAVDYELHNYQERQEGIEIYRYCTVCGKEYLYRVIRKNVPHKVSVTVDEPLIGNTVSRNKGFTFASYGDDGDIKPDGGVMWFESSSKPTSFEQCLNDKTGTYKRLADGARFQNGKYYTVAVIVYPGYGYQWPLDIASRTPTINGLSAKASDFYMHLEGPNITDRTAPLVVYYTFGPLAPKTTVTSINIVDVKEPVIGVQTSYDYTILGSDCEKVEWDITGRTGIWRRYYYPIEDNNTFWSDSFVADEKAFSDYNYYAFGAIVKPKEGYVMASNVTATINGRPAFVTEYDDYLGGYVVVTCFDALMHIDPESGAAVSGSFKSFGGESNFTYVELFRPGETDAAYTKAVTGSSGSYSISGVAAGTYTMKVSKLNHVTREYTVTVGTSNVTKNVEIRLLGDITGDGNVNTSDVGRANAHAKNSSLLTDYALKCADVTGDGNVNTSDVGRINAHAKGSNPLWK